MYLLANSEVPHSRPVIWMYIVACVLSCALNGYWFSIMLKTVMQPPRAKQPKKLE